jgi:hypothetical protein
MNYKCGAKPVVNPEQYTAFDKDTHIKAGVNIGSGAIDLRPFSVSIHDQLSTSSCTGNAMTKALEIKRVAKYYKDFITAGQDENTALKNARAKHVNLSRLYLYWGGRAKASPPETFIDNGTQIDFVAETLRIDGVCEESTWTFDINNVNTPPSIICDREATINKVDGHFRLANVGDALFDDINTNLQLFNPIICWFRIGSDFGKLQPTDPPLVKESNPTGLHALCIVAMNDDNSITVENSWGVNYPRYYTVSKDYILTPGNCGDFWAINAWSSDWKEGV